MSRSQRLIDLLRKGQSLRWHRGRTLAQPTTGQAGHSASSIASAPQNRPLDAAGRSVDETPPIRVPLTHFANKLGLKWPRLVSRLKPDVQAVSIIDLSTTQLARARRVNTCGWAYGGPFAAPGAGTQLGGTVVLPERGLYIVSATGNLSSNTVCTMQLRHVSPSGLTLGIVNWSVGNGAMRTGDVALVAEEVNSGLEVWTPSGSAASVHWSIAFRLSEIF